MGVQCLLPSKQLLAADSTVHFQAGDGIVSRETEPVDTGSVQPGAACVRPGSDNTPSCAISSTEHWGGPGQQCLRLPHTGHVPTRAAGAVYKTYSAQQKPVAARVQTKVFRPCQARGQNSYCTCRPRAAFRKLSYRRGIMLPCLYGESVFPASLSEAEVLLLLGRLRARPWACSAWPTNSCLRQTMLCHSRKVVGVFHVKQTRCAQAQFSQGQHACALAVTTRVPVPSPSQSIGTARSVQQCLCLPHRGRAGERAAKGHSRHTVRSKCQGCQSTDKGFQALPGQRTKFVLHMQAPCCFQAAFRKTGASSCPALSVWPRVYSQLHCPKLKSCCCAGDREPGHGRAVHCLLPGKLVLRQTALCSSVQRMECFT